MIKRCSKCKIDKLIEEFDASNSNKDKLQYICKECFQNYYTQNRKNIRLKHTLYKEQLKIEVLSHYSEFNYPICGCGETDIRCLSIDHINNGEQNIAKKSVEFIIG